jgi:Fur family ferric uptake transcriptional regulator/Fur family peroxide stress response transcriptional regulator
MQRNTYQKQIVMQAVNEFLGQHPTADCIFEYARTRVPTITLATVYRILNQMSISGNIKEVYVPNSASRFDGRTERHFHILCQSCKRVADFEADAAFAEPTLPQGDKSGCTVTGMEITFLGVCAECGKAGKGGEGGKPQGCV